MGKEEMEENEKASGFQYFVLGFSVCALLFNTVILIIVF